jgi:molecular chaperone Hsp33
LGEVLADDGRLLVSGGLLIQDIPTKGEEIIIDQLRERLQEMPPLSAFLKEGKSPEEILEIVFADIPYDTLEKRDLRFQCDCSWDRTRQALATLGSEELQQLLESDGEVTVNCHYCHQEYHFNEFDLEVLIMEISTDE